MHNNYYFLKQLTQQLKQKLIDKKTGEIFSQQKDELILGFYSDTDQYYIRANLHPDYGILSFMEEFNRARYNSVNIFTEIPDLKVINITQHLNERSFHISLENDYALMFKMHGQRTNIILFNENKPYKLFKNKLQKDWLIDLYSVHKNINQNFDAFKEAHGDIKKVFPTFDKIVINWLQQEGINDKDIEGQWAIIQKALKYLENPYYYLIFFNNKPALSLLPYENTQETLKNPIEAANQFQKFYAKNYQLAKEKQEILNILEKQRKKANSYIQKSEEKLKEIKNKSRYEEMGNIIMANIHQLQEGIKEAHLYDFYCDSYIQIPLKQKLSPQKNAEYYYQKAKNQKYEIESLEKNIENKKALINNIDEYIYNIKDIEDIRSLRKYIKSKGIKPEQKQIGNETLNSRFITFNIDDYQIYAGKNAKNNDELTLNFAVKDDLWLHAKDAQGSHVIIKKKGNQNFPAHIIEKAAKIAAKNSKAKNDTVVPVIYTPVKYVKKGKNMAPGAVKLEREKVIIVKPSE